MHSLMDEKKDKNDSETFAVRCSNNHMETMFACRTHKIEVVLHCDLTAKACSRRL